MISPRSAVDLLCLAPALDEGRGSAYERYAMDRFLEALLERLQPGSVLEIPSNGVMGVPGLNSLVVAARGLRPTLAVPLAEVADEIRRLWEAIGLESAVVVTDYDSSGFEDRSFDLVWNFCSLEHSRDPAALIGEMVRVSARHVLVVTQNRRNPGLPIHRLQHKLDGEPWDHGEMSLADPGQVRALLEEAGARTIESGGVDLPPWPDINVQLRPSTGTQREDYPEDYQHLRPGVLRQRTEVTIDRLSALGGGSRPLDLWPHFYRGWNAVERAIPSQVKAWAAHHPYVLAEVQSE